MQHNFYVKSSFLKKINKTYWILISYYVKNSKEMTKFPLYPWIEFFKNENIFDFFGWPIQNKKFDNSHHLLMDKRGFLASLLNFWHAKMLKTEIFQLIFFLNWWFYMEIVIHFDIIMLGYLILPIKLDKFQKSTPKMGLKIQYLDKSYKIPKIVLEFWIE